jgi:tetratricopeptide (TPR) repeat protein
MKNATVAPRFRFPPTWALTALALLAIAAWPFVVRHDTVAALPTEAPVTADYTLRDKTIKFWEGAVAEHHSNDYISPQTLSQQYLQRYRERGDIGDVLRAERAAKRALAIAPVSIGAIAGLASVDLTLHRFKAALALVRHAEALAPDLPLLAVNEASLELEIGDYDGARALITKIHAIPGNRNAGDVIEARYDEETGHLADARALLERATAYGNAAVDTPAQARAWYYFREGELAFEAGEIDNAIAFERKSLAVFPDYVEATRAAARFECAAQRWQACLDDARRSAEVTPYPETLGFEADAYRALGRDADARATDDLIVAIDKIGNTQRVSDRLLAVYWSDHRMHSDEAYAIAKRELAARDDIYTDDTLAWAAAMDGRWDEARAASRRALRFGTEDARLHYHAGMIAQHFGDRDEAKRQLERALALNPTFGVGADDARTLLARL